MAQIENIKQALISYGVEGVEEVIYNPSYEELFEAEMNPELTGYEKGTLTELGAVNVMTGIYTGRSPKDKYFVMDDVSRDTVWWTSDEYKNDNKSVTQEVWKELKQIALNELSNKKLYVVDGYAHLIVFNRCKSVGNICFKNSFLACS